MTREEVIAMAREAGAKERFVPHPDGMSITGEEFTLNQLERFAALVAAREREACAKVCENRFGAWNDVAQKCAEDIRSRSTD